MLPCLHGHTSLISQNGRLGIAWWCSPEETSNSPLFIFFLLTTTVSFPPLPDHQSGDWSPPVPRRRKCLFCTVSMKYTVQKSRGFAWGPHCRASHEKKPKNNIVSLKNTPLAGLVIHSTIVKIDKPSAMQSQCFTFILISFYYQVTMKLTLPG